MCYFEELQLVLWLSLLDFQIDTFSSILIYLSADQESITKTFEFESTQNISNSTWNMFKNIE